MIQKAKKDAMERVQRIETINNMEEFTQYLATSSKDNDQKILQNIRTTEEQLQVPRGVSFDSEKLMYKD